jgi:hypothetical protein
MKYMLADILEQLVMAVVWGTFAFTTLGDLKYSYIAEHTARLVFLKVIGFCVFVLFWDSQTLVKLGPPWIKLCANTSTVMARLARRVLNFVESWV